MNKMTTVKRIYNVDIKRIPPSQLRHKVLPKLASLPKVVDLRSKMPPVYDQGQLGSCTANALSACFEYEDKNAFTPSRLFVYYNERVLEHDVSEDSGAQLYDGIKTLEKYGVCPESEWPYDITKFTVKPPAHCYTDALKYKAVSVTNIPQDVTSMKTSLAHGYPFVVGISVYSSFESDAVAASGIVPMPDVNNEECLGGHAILCQGFDDTKGHWIMRNSWGDSWGDKGAFYLPYLYLLDSNLSSDLWNITKVTSS